MQGWRSATAWTAAWGEMNAQLLTIAPPSLSWRYPEEGGGLVTIPRVFPGLHFYLSLISPKILPYPHQWWPCVENGEQRSLGGQSCRFDNSGF